jgi:hypothetical protein
MRPPTPVCKAFLICDKIVDWQGDTVILGLPDIVTARSFPCRHPLSFFAPLTSAHGRYLVEIQLRTLDGETVWREGPPEPWKMDDPLKQIDVKFNVIVTFPAAGDYEFVLLNNGQDVARQGFKTKLKPESGA